MTNLELVSWVQGMTNIWTNSQGPKHDSWLMEIKPARGTVGQAPHLLHDNHSWGHFRSAEGWLVGVPKMVLSMYKFQFFCGCQIWICHYFLCPTHLGAKIGPQKGVRIQSFHSEQFMYQYKYFWGCRLRICHYFSCPTHLGANIGPQKGGERGKIQSFWLEQFIYQFQYFWGCQIPICHGFSYPPHMGAKWGSKRA